MSFIVGIGVDPGFANLGVAGVARHEDGRLESLGVRVVVTKPDNSGAFSRLRAGADDERRYQVMYEALAESTRKLKPACMGVERYTVREPEEFKRLRGLMTEVYDLVRAGAPALGADLMQRVRDFAPTLAELNKGKGGPGLGNATKTLAVFGVAHAVAYAEKVPVFEFEPSDLKMPFGGRRSASKDEVMTGVGRQVQGFQERLAQMVPQRTLQEHASDATGHAVLALNVFASLSRGVR